MRNLSLNKSAEPALEIWKALMLFVILALLWPFAQDAVLRLDPTSGYVDRSILILVLLALICFMGVTGLCWWLLKRFWTILGLPGLGGMLREQFLLTKHHAEESAGQGFDTGGLSNVQYWLGEKRYQQSRNFFILGLLYPPFVK